MSITSFFRLLAITLLIGWSIACSALAEPSDIAPSDWQRGEQGENVIYRSPDRVELMIFRDVEGAGNPTAIAEAASQALAKAWDGDVRGSIDDVDGVMAVYTFEFSGENKTFVGRSYAFERSSGVFLTLVHVAPKGADGLDERMEQTREKVLALATAARGGVASSEQPATEPAARTTTADLEAMLMTYAYGVGSVTVKTHYLFADGSLCSCTELAPADAFSSLAERGADELGEWRADGSRYQVRMPGKGKWKLLKKPLRAAALPESWRGQGTYRTIDTFGGANTGFPEFFAGAWSDLTLRPDGTFTTGGGAMATGSDVDVTTTMGRDDAIESGTYEINGFTLRLHFDNGHEERTSIAWDGVAKDGEDPYETVWIRGSSFKRAGGS